MELRDLIERAEEAAGGRKELAAALFLHPQQLTNAKAHKAGLPTASCFRLAEIIQEDARTVIAASELVTEKKPERRAVLLPFVRHAAAIALVTGVNLLMTPAPAQAAPVLNNAPSHFVLCKLRCKVRLVLVIIGLPLHRHLAGHREFSP